VGVLTVTFVLAIVAFVFTSIILAFV